jgi:hypothetical protein
LIQASGVSEEESGDRQSSLHSLSGAVNASFSWDDLRF